MQKNYIYRGGFYLVGLLVLALGISLNTKTGLGVSPIISVSYSISTIWNLNFGNMTMVLYCIFVLVEILLHTILCRKELKREDIALEHANEMNLKLVLIMDLLQIPLSLVFTRFLNVFGAWIPDQLCRNIFRTCIFPDHCYYTDRRRCRHVTEHAYHSKSGRRYRTGNC